MSKKTDDIQTARIQWDRYTRARDAGHLDYCDIAKKCDAYYRGEQWDEQDVAQLDAEGRPALTINTILSTINAVLGHQTSQRADIVFKPRRAAEQGMAETLTKVFKQIWDNNNMDFVESEVFGDGVIQDRGYFDIRMDYDDHVEGEIKVTVEDPLDIIPDPDSKEYNPKSWNEVFKTRWMTLDEIEEQYGKAKSKELRYVAQSGENFGKDSFEWKEQTERFGDTGLANYKSHHITEDETFAVRSVRVVERQHRKMYNAPHFMNPVTGDMRKVPYHLSDAEAREFADANNLFIEKKMVRCVRWTVTCDRVVLYDDWSPYPDFTIIPYFPYFRRGKPFGLVRNLLSPQEQLNKVASQELHIVNTTANSGWIIETGSLSNMDADDLAERGAETGLVLVHNRGSEPPAKIPPNQIPQGLDRIGMKAQQNIKEISGITDVMLGHESREVSGVAIEAKKHSGQVQIQVPMENLRRTRHILASHMLDLIQGYYTEPRIIQVTNEAEPDQPREQLEVNTLDPQTGRIVNDLTIGEYDIAVATAPARDNFNDIQFAQALNLRQVGVAVPDDMIVQYSNLHKKGELAKEIRMMTGREQSPEQQQIDQMQQQLAMQNMQMEVTKLQAEIEKLKADATLALAKARSEGMAPEMDLQKMDAEAQGRTQELQARLQMSDMANTATVQKQSIVQDQSLASAAMKAQTATDVARIQAEATRQSSRQRNAKNGRGTN